MADDKPLPGFIVSGNKKSHSAALIGHFLKDLNDPGIESRHDRWLKVFEGVLDNLGKHIHSADGIKRGTEFKKLTGSRTTTTPGQKATESQQLNGAEVAGSSERDKGKITIPMFQAS